YAWWMQTGNPGTILSISKIPDIGDVQQIYYKDDASGTNDDISSSDTGDKESWGDTGAKFHGNITSNEIQMATRMYFLGSGVDPDSAESIKESIENPLNVSVSSYNYPVPVELAGFDISAFKNQISLTWSTATETNNLGFDIERRFKGDADYQKIGFVEGAGTTTKQQFYTFHDTAGDVGTVYYRLKQIDTGGAFQYYEKNIVVFPPDRFMLAQNFPNPFNPSTTIGYEIAGDGDRLAIDVYDLLGRYVRSLVRENSRAGYHTAFWDGRDEQGQIVGSGVYMCVLTCGTTRITKKMIKLQ
ncbi:T9SS type A sorting domain-containing protein, partial [candidate division KSB1 bacterium]|nr:T9SS type A sorting domain-containing protein [candidate division KSB1 bacterium]